MRPSWKGRRRRKNKNKMEKRFFNTTTRADENGDFVEGHGIVFDQRTELGDGFYEIIEANGYEGSGDVIVTFNHDFSRVLGRESAGTAEIKKTEKGILYRAMLPGTTFANDLKESLQRGDVKGSSFSFQVLDADYEETEDSGVLRRVKKYKVFEMGPVTFPAYWQTDAALKSVKRDFENAKAEIQGREKKAAQQALKNKKNDFTSRFNLFLLEVVGSESE